MTYLPSHHSSKRHFSTWLRGSDDPEVKIGAKTIVLQERRCGMPKVHPRLRRIAFGYMFMDISF
jgi:hypothetical protein